MIKERLIAHFSHPRGVLGWVAGRIMATRDTNVARNAWIADILDPAPDARILEIGHGPGLAIEAIVPQLDGGSVVGVDISSLMESTAARRNRAAVADGTVAFEVADSANLPEGLDGFDLIYGVNASMFWDNPATAVKGLASRLADGGELVLAYMPPPTSDLDPADVAAELRDLFEGADLVGVTEAWMDFEPPTVAVRGRRQP